MALLWCWCEGPLWLRPILEDSHFMPACDTSNMASVFTLIYAHDVRTGAKFAPRSLFAAKLVGRSGDGPRFAGGPKVLPFGEMLIYYFFGSYHREKIRSSADIDASHFTTACEASIWPHTYKNAILPPGLVRAPVQAVAVRGEVPRDTGAERDLPRPSYRIPSLTMHAHELACLSFALPAHHPHGVARW